MSFANRRILTKFPLVIVTVSLLTGEPHDMAWNIPRTFDEIYRVATARGLHPTF